MPLLDREEYIEQAYFFQAFRERIVDGVPAQEVLSRIGEEILSTTKLPMAIAFLFAECKLVGALAPAMVRINHYFSPFQSFVVARAEEDVGRFSMDQALLILEREARYKADAPTPAGLFVYQFETVSRNRLGYLNGLGAIADDGIYDENWHDYILILRTRLGDVDFADLIYARSSFHVAERRRRDPDYVSKFPILFGDKEGKIARANRGRDPLYLFSALQRQLGYPEVPRPKKPEELDSRIVLVENRLAQLENRLKLLESDSNKDDFDLSQLTVKPEQTAGTPVGWGKKTLDD